MTLILGIETSCDETSVAIVADGRHVRSHFVSSQLDVHARYGGVVPELASRAHLERLDALVREALVRAAATPSDLDAIAVTAGPGLIGALLIGVTAGKTLAWAWSKPLIDVNHIHAHAISAALAPSGSDQPPAHPWPAVALVVSGGHTSLFWVPDPVRIQRLGRTIDDAAGEAFDKVATILGLGYPGGPVVDRRAARGKPDRFRFPRTTLAPDSLDFSFSGLKTAVLYQVHGPGRTSGGLGRWAPEDVDDLCASFSAAVVDVLVAKSMSALERTGAPRLLVGGGVAANSMLRGRLVEACTARGASIHLTPMEFCTDNAAMIAALGHHRFVAGQRADLSLAAYAT